MFHTARMFAICLLGAILAACGAGQGAPGAGGQSGADIDRLATYQGADRQATLEAGARKEGKMSLYTVAVAEISKPIIDAFRQKYPYIEVEQFRGGTAEVTTRTLEEYQAKRYQADVLEANAFVGPLKDKGIVRRYWSPELANYPDRAKDPDGVSAAVRESPRGFGFNTKTITKDQAPKTWADLLDPKWKGKITMSGDDTLTRFVGLWLETQGEDYIQKLATQNLTIVHGSVRAVADMVASGEAVLSPTINAAHVEALVAKGAPVGWIAPNPVDSVVIQMGLASHAPHPNAALLYLDFVLSNEGQQLGVKGGYASARNGLAPAGDKAYTAFYVDSLPNPVERSQQWEKLAAKYFHTGA